VREQKPHDEIVVNGDNNFTLANVRNSVIGDHAEMTFGEMICHFIMMGKAGIVDAAKFKEVDAYLKSCIPPSRIARYNRLILNGDEKDFWYMEIFFTAYSDLESEFHEKVSEMLSGIDIVTTSYTQAYDTNKGSTTTNTINVTGNGNQTYSNISNSNIKVNRR
jgi:hypothetical protein